jgi:glucose-1-phosphate adenylyltransferase
VLVLAGDHVYKMDYRPMLEAHRARHAAVTVGCAHVPVADARHFGVVTPGEDDRIERFVEKPRSLADVPATRDGEVLASMGIYVFDGPLLARILHRDAAQPESEHDFGSDILPRLIEGGCAYTYSFRDAGGARPAYWRDVGTLRAYWRAHMDLLGQTPQLALNDPTWPVVRTAATPQIVTAATSTANGGSIENSVVAAKTRVSGQLARSVAFDGVEIGRGASVVESVLLPGAVVGAGSRLHGVIVDAGYRVPEGTVLEQNPSVGEPPVLSAQIHASSRRASAL